MVLKLVVWNIYDDRASSLLVDGLQRLDSFGILPKPHSSQGGGNLRFFHPQLDTRSVHHATYLFTPELSPY